VPAGRAPKLAQLFLAFGVTLADPQVSERVVARELLFLSR
jgi:hypothetical protein